MDSKDALHLIATLTRMIGEDNMVKEMQTMGWPDPKDHPVAFFKGYLEGHKDSEYEQGSINLAVSDMTGIANRYGLDVKGDEIVDIIPR